MGFQGISACHVFCVDLAAIASEFWMGFTHRINSILNLSKL